MYRYKKDNQLITSSIPLQGLTLITLSDEDVKYFVGFDTTCKPIIDKNKFVEIEKQKRVNEINAEFDRQCSKVGIDFEGNKFQYDDISRSRLYEAKDDDRIVYWISSDNNKIPLSNAKKNLLYKLMIETFYTEFDKKSKLIYGLK